MIKEGNPKKKGTNQDLIKTQMLQYQTRNTKIIGGTGKSLYYA